MLIIKDVDEVRYTTSKSAFKRKTKVDLLNKVLSLTDTISVDGGGIVHSSIPFENVVQGITDYKERIVKSLDGYIAFHFFFDCSVKHEHSWNRLEHFKDFQFSLEIHHYKKKGILDRSNSRRTA